MNPYALSLAIGATGTAVMALRGLGVHAGHLGHGGHDAHGHAGLDHGGHGGHGGQAVVHHAGHHGTDSGHAGHYGSGKVAGGQILSLLSPRVLFTFLVGVGATGLLAGRILVEPLLLGAALVGGVAFERFIVRPIWDFLFRFESRPAATLESIVMEEARAETDFDQDGRGLISVDLDGQVVQLLGALKSDDRALGVKVRRGGRVRIEEVDAARHRCVVSYIGE